VTRFIAFGGTPAVGSTFCPLLAHTRPATGPGMRDLYGLAPGKPKPVFLFIIVERVFCFFAIKVLKLRKML
jgi:hypothetical protein